MKIFKGIFLITIFCCSLFTSCFKKDDNINTGRTIVGKGDLVTRTLNLGEFTSFSLEGQCNVTIAKGDTQKITLRAQQNIIDTITLEVINNTLVYSQNNYNFQPSKGIFLDIITPNAISAVSIVGAGDITISGDKQNTFNINITGTGIVDAYGLEVDNCTINISGVGNCKVLVNDKLNINISGNGDVKYKGNPVVVPSISGNGSIEVDN